MAKFYDENRFTLRQDWNWSRIVRESDTYILKYVRKSNRHEHATNHAYKHMCEYLGIASEQELTREHLQECETLIDYLEAPYDKGGQAMSQSSPTYSAYIQMMQNWIRNFDYGEN